MVLIYGSNEPRTGGSFGTPAVMRAWQTHVENRAYLFFMYTKGTFAERQQASKELSICDRKIAFWERHPAFDKAQGARINSRVKADWASR